MGGRALSRFGGWFTAALLGLALTGYVPVAGPAEAAKHRHCKRDKRHKKRCHKHRKKHRDRVPPAAPILNSTNPVSPGSGTSPRVLGTAEDESTIRIYTDPACSAQAGTGSAGQLTTSGITASVLRNATTTFYGTATDNAGNVSACSSPPLTYVESPVRVSTSPSLYPSFDPTVDDYVTRCDGTTPVGVSVDTPHGSTVSVDGSKPRNGTYSVPVDLHAGQEFSFSVVAAEYAKTFYVRCLPPDFPGWSFTRNARPDSPFYLVNPNLRFTGLPSHWVAMFDRDGVPVWWANPARTTFDAKVLDDGSIATTGWDGPGYQIHRLDGTLLGTVRATGGSTDTHDLQQLPNGDFLVLQYRPREHVDLSPYGGPADATVADGVVQEIDQSGNLVWEWNSKDHIDLAETGRWWPEVLGGTAPYDIVHVNAVEPDGDSILVSFRHTDAIYRISRTTGEVEWKLGGTATPKSLLVEGDPYGTYPLGGQHDPRRQVDGSVTIHDNATGLTSGSNHPPRSVRYAIDENEGTATLVESVEDPAVTSSICCGSSRRSAKGSWLMDWDSRLVTEFNANHVRIFSLTFTDAFSYRAFPVPRGLLDIGQIRSGMDTMFPRD